VLTSWLCPSCDWTNGACREGCSRCYAARPAALTPIETPYGTFRLHEVEAWPVETCPECGRAHAHPPGVTAEYFPECWTCRCARFVAARKAGEEAAHGRAA